MKVFRDTSVDRGSDMSVDAPWVVWQANSNDAAVSQSGHW